MKKLFKFNKEKVKAICIGTMLAGFLFSSSNIYATELEAELSTEYLNWASSENRNLVDMPKTYGI